MKKNLLSHESRNTELKENPKSLSGPVFCVQLNEISDSCLLLPALSFT